MLLGVVIICCFSLVFVWLIPKIKNSLYEGKYQKTRHIVETAWGILDYYAKLSKTKVLTEEEAKNKLKK